MDAGHDAQFRTEGEAARRQVRLAVFTTRYPARSATFFRRDMSALLAAGIEVDVFPIYPMDATLWSSGLDIVDKHAIANDHVHNIGVGAMLRRAWPWPPRAVGRFVRDAAAVGASAARYGLVPLAKSAYVLPKAWAWAAQHADRYNHVLAYWGNYAGTCAYAFHRLLNRPIPFSIWLHAGTDLYLRQVFLREKLLYADNIITCCAFNRQYMSQRYPDLAPQIADKTHVCYHGLDLSTFPFAPDHRPAHRIIAVGRLARFKGFDYLLRAARALRDRGMTVELELIGDGPERGALETLARELGIAVVFRGYLPFSAVQTAMSQATILVHPSDGLGDGLPNVLREAMAVGTPVIASRVAGIPEALDDGRCGTLVPPKDVPALAEAIHALLSDADLRRRHAMLGRRRTEELFDVWRNGAQLAERLRSTTRLGLREHTR
jgi:glycosyltransferase involved in cell wall biosynthesis